MKNTNKEGVLYGTVISTTPELQIRDVNNKKTYTISRKIIAKDSTIYQIGDIIEYKLNAKKLPASIEYSENNGKLTKLFMDVDDLPKTFTRKYVSISTHKLQSLIIDAVINNKDADIHTILKNKGYKIVGTLHTYDKDIRPKQDGIKVLLEYVDNK